MVWRRGESHRRIRRFEQGFEIGRECHMVGLDATTCLGGFLICSPVGVLEMNGIMRN
jgi:hypothetical protein